MACKSGFEVLLLHLGPSCPLQTNRLGDLVWCDSPRQMVMTVWRTFFEASQTATRLDGQHYPL
jgi:hypothetical protein